MESIEFFVKAAGVFDQLVEQIKDDQWDNQTPDTDWKVRDLVNHLVSEEIWIPEMLEGKTVVEVGDKYDGDLLGDDPKAAWVKAYRAGVAAFKAVDPEQTVHLSFGDVPAEAYADQMFGDHLVHSWDLAKGLGVEPDLPGELVEQAYKYFQKFAEDWRSGGAFKAAKSIPDNAQVLDKLLGLTGRNPEWRP